MPRPPALRLTRRFTRRAAFRGLFAGALVRAWLLVVARASGRRMPVAVGAVAAAGAGATLELPLAAPVAAAAVAVVGTRAVRNGHRPATVAAVTATSAVAAVAARRWWPVPPRGAAELTPHSTHVGAEPSPTGKGLSIVVNPDAGPAFSRNPAEILREELPDAEVIEVDDATNLLEALQQACEHADAIGVAGGDGTVNAGAAAALKHDKPLMVVPAGTLNHLARDLGLLSVDDATEAVRKGQTVAMDAAEIDGRVFLNTASFGSYTALVDAREQLEERLGKWPAMVVALVRVLRTGEPVEVEVDGRRRHLWMIFVGNCRYHPAGFAPSWREELDDGLLDVRMVDAGHPFARVRLVLAILTGTLARSRVYDEFQTDSFTVRSLDGPLRLARDGETFDGHEEFTVCKHPKELAVYVPYGES